jgi:indole-3-acetate monooxygenase
MKGASVVDLLADIASVILWPASGTILKHGDRTILTSRSVVMTPARSKETFVVTTNIQSIKRRIDAAIEQPESKATLSAAIDKLAPGLATRAEDIEHCRRVPADIIDTLRRAGLFRALVPRSHGGFAMSVPEVLPMLQTLAAADSSVGWVAMIAMASHLFCSRLARANYDSIYAGGAEAMVVGVGTPAGRATMIDGGYRVSGRWPFASGCQNAQWIVGHCVVCDNDEPVMSDQGPVTKFVIAPAERWRIEETWRAAGLTGSGSHHVILDNVDIANACAFDALHGPSSVPGLFEGAAAPFSPTMHSAVAVGIATGAIADLAALAGAGRRQLFAAVDLKDSPVFQHEFGRLGAELRAARALLDVQAARQWRRSVDGTLDGKVDFAESLQGSAWIHAACTNVVSGCYTLGGASVVMNTSPLQRRLRDIHATKQHVFAQERFYANAGRHALGFPPSDPLSKH